MQFFQEMKKNGFTYVMVALTLIVLVAAFMRSWDTMPEDPVSLTTEAISTSETSESPSEIEETAYFFLRTSDQRFVIGLRPLDPSEYPKNFKFTQYDENDYRLLKFYEVALLEISQDSLERVISAVPLHLIHYKSSPLTETVYRQMSIRYEDGFAIYTHDRETFVTSLSHPKVYRTYTLFGGPFFASQTDDPQTLLIVESNIYHQIFDTVNMRFVTEIKPQEDPLATPFDWDSKTITHLASDPLTHGPSLSKITDEPRLRQIVLNASTDKLFEALGKPVNKGWLMGDYLTYDDLLVYSGVDEDETHIDLYPVVAITYFGEYPIAGVKKGMSFATVEQILGVPERVHFTESSELAYPLMLGYVIDGFSIGLSFDANFEVTNFFIRLENWKGEEPHVPYEPFIDDTTFAYSPEKLSFEGLLDITDFKYIYNACFFNSTDGFYRYDFTRSAPEKVLGEQMRPVFEIQHVANPSLVAVGKSDGILYRIDLNTYETIPFSGPHYKDYYINEGSLIKQSLISDDALLDKYGYKSAAELGSFEVKVPMNWNVLHGDYPEGLYWHIADVLSSDIGLSLQPLKGKTVTATVYNLETEIPDRDTYSSFKRPVNAVILRSKGLVVGSWLMYNTMLIGPSMNQLYLEDIVNKDFDHWVEETGIIVIPTSYAPMPRDAIHIFFSAIDSGEKKRAITQLSPVALLNALTVNHDPATQLYHTGFNEDNSSIENIISAKNVEIVRFYEPMSLKDIMSEEAIFDEMPIGGRISAEINLEIRWRDPAFNASNDLSTLFVGLRKTTYGWKLDGFGTGP